MDSDTSPLAMWNARYAAAADAHNSVWSVEPNAWVAATIGPLPPGSAVDLGCGEGRNAIWLASLGWVATGVDFSAAGIDVAAARARQAGVDVAWHVADATTWRATTPVDLVLIAYLHLSEEDLLRAVANAIASLTPGGRLVMIGHDRTNVTDGVGGPQRPEILYSPDLLARAAEGLIIETCERVMRPVETADGVRSAIDTTLVARTPL
jgi:SAM-dependent methyltransferase